MTHKPLVSVVISNYNYVQFLPTAIESVLQQTYEPIELIIVDDGSTDESRTLIANYCDTSLANGRQIVPIFQENGGHASTFNAGFAASNGEIVCFLDADDIFESNKVEKVVAVFEAHPSVEWCFHALQLFNTQTQEKIGVTWAFPKQREDLSGVCDFRQSIQQGYLNFYPPSTSGLCFRRQLLSAILPMPTALQMAADRYLVQSAIILSVGYFLRMPLTRQGIHDSNDCTMATTLGSKKKKAQHKILEAYFLNAKFPNVWKFNHRTFAAGWGAFRKYGFDDAEIAQLKREYLGSVSFLEKMAIWAISLYQNRPWKRVQLYRDA